MNVLFIALSIWISDAFSHGGGEASIEVGPDKGVIEVAKDKSFKLSPEALKRLQISMISFDGNTITLPKSAIARNLSESHVFRVRDGWIKAVAFQIVSKTETSVTLKSSSFAKGDSFIKEGVGFVRIIASQLGEAEENHHDEHEDEDGHHDEESKTEEHHHD